MNVNKREDPIAQNVWILAFLTAVNELTNSNYFWYQPFIDRISILASHPISEIIEMAECLLLHEHTIHIFAEKGCSIVAKDNSIGVYHWDNLKDVVAS